jgi:hypothetical protein
MPLESMSALGSADANEKISRKSMPKTKTTRKNLSKGSIQQNFKKDKTFCKGKIAVWRRPGLAEQPWGSIRRDGLPARLGEHWEAACMRPCAGFSPS